jgi:RNA polymerase sigma factor (sigma-70 family)
VCELYPNEFTVECHISRDALLLNRAEGEGMTDILVCPVGSLGRGTVFVLDDDLAVRSSLETLLTSAGYRVEVDKTGREFLHRRDIPHPACLLLDHKLPDGDATWLREELRRMGRWLPIIMISGRANYSDVVEAIRDGVIDFLPKPFDGESLLMRVSEAIDKDDQEQREFVEREAMNRRLASLTPREREVMEAILDGKINKRIAADLGLSIKTVEYHRKRLMQKLSVDNTAMLVRLVQSAEPERYRMPMRRAR